MIVNPNGILRIYRDVPWHSDYEHVRLFEDRGEQASYFNGRSKYQFTDFSYIREERALRVPVCADNLYDCNYLSFQNRGFGTRNFYAFITDVKYINTETCEVYFQIDVFQTWWLDCEISDCFIEREHVGDDTIGLHTVDEGLYFGDYIARQMDNQVYANWYVQFKFAPSYYVEEHRGDYNFTYSTSAHQLCVMTKQYYLSPTSPSNWLKQIIDEINGEVSLGNEVIAINLIPAQWIDYYDDVEAGGNRVICKTYPSASNPNHPNFGIPSNFVNAIGTDVEEPYAPINGKLFVYPYCLLRVSNQTDSIRDFRWENFNVFTPNTNHPMFFIRYNYINHISCELVPFGYNGVVGYNEAIPLDNFPTVDFHATDEFGVLKSVLSNISTTLGYVLGGAIGGVSGGVTGAGAGARIGRGIGSTVGNLTSQVLGAEFGGMRDNSQTKLGGSNANLDLKYRTFGFWFYSMSIKAEYAKIIDNYFTRYGYKINRVKAPELHNRERFNYIKTVGAVIKGKTIGDVKYSAPDEAETEMARIFDSGVTFWHDNDIGNYSGNGII